MLTEAGGGGQAVSVPVTRRLPPPQLVPVLVTEAQCVVWAWSRSAALRALRAGWAAVREKKQEEQQQCRRALQRAHSSSPFTRTLR